MMNYSEGAFTDDPDKNASKILSNLPRGIMSLPPGLAAAAKLAANLRPAILDSPAMEFARRAQERMQQQEKALEIARTMSEALGRHSAISQMMAIEQRHRQILVDAQGLFANRDAMAAIPFETQLAREQTIALQTERLFQNVSFARNVIEAFDRVKDKHEGILSEDQPTILLPMAVAEVEGATSEGDIIVACSIPWFTIVEEIERNPDFLFQFVKHPNNFEQFIAASYDKLGCKVTLTPRSGDLGRDIIATIDVPSIGTVRIYDQVKAYSPGHRVLAKDVREIFGVMSRDRGITKAILTTSSSFAPGIMDEWKDWMPNRLQLREGKQLREWLISIAKRETER